MYIAVHMQVPLKIAQYRIATASRMSGDTLRKAGILPDLRVRLRPLGRRWTNRCFAAQLATAQRAHKVKRVKAIHARIKYSRQDAIHKFTTRMVENHGAIFVGDVSSKRLVRTRMAKSVLDSGWGMLRTQLEYKANARSVVFEEVCERNTTQTCSCCGSLSASSPKGRAGLRIRAWTCCECGATHDRDINAAKNILALGHERLAGGIPFL